MSRPPAVGVHLFIGFNGTTIADANPILKAVQPGGLVLFLRNCVTSRQLRTLCADLGPRQIIAIDQENRRVNRLRHVTSNLPGIADLKQAGTPRAAERFGRRIGRDLRRFGIHLDFAPVVDLELFDKQTDNALRERCWGRTPTEVTVWAGAFLDGLQAAGVAGCLKHFPGLGAATSDSHDELPVIRRSRAQLLAEDVAPYQALGNRVACVMVGHGKYPAFDSVPASLSAKIVTGCLREELGFQGVILSDDLEMGALAAYGSVGERAVRALQAGCDAVLVCHTPECMIAARLALEQAFARGELDAEQLAKSRRRLAAFRRRWIGTTN